VPGLRGAISLGAHHQEAGHPALLPEPYLRIQGAGRIINASGTQVHYCEKRLTSLITAVSLQKNKGSRMIQPFAIINLFSLINVIIAGVIIGDDDKGLVMA
jgi:hypothetical protein